MKNVSFLQLVLGVAGGLMIYAGIKDIDINVFLHTLVTNPSGAFTGSYQHSTTVITNATKGQGQRI